jgi:uncharacterized protein (TIGR03000 family)
VVLAQAGTARAGILGFGEGIGPAMWYGPYTGGHMYSYNTAYGYGLSFTAADSWRRDPLAYPYGPYAYPYGPYPPRRFFFVTPPPGALPPAAGAVVVHPAGQPLGLHPVPEAATRPAVICVAVPPEAEVWFEGNKTVQAGRERTFQSPPLAAGSSYVYTVRARWKQDGKEVDQVQAVGVQAGQTARVSFPAPRP